jgi:hypothetical protein
MMTRLGRLAAFLSLLFALVTPVLAGAVEGRVFDAASGRPIDGKLFRDHEHLAWIDPFRREAWDYLLDLAVEAATLDFDEIQFDYVRFPDSREAQFSEPNTQANRVAAITGFLQAARSRLVPYMLRLGFAPLGDNPHVQAMRQDDGGPYDGRVIPVVRNIAHEGL